MSKHGWRWPGLGDLLRGWLRDSMFQTMGGGEGGDAPYLKLVLF